jgi:multisubunit Na+/H+ antiporter MnhF subunit
MPIVGIFFHFCKECQWYFNRFTVDLLMVLDGIKILTILIHLLHEQGISTVLACVFFLVSFIKTIVLSYRLCGLVLCQLDTS